MNSHVFDSVFRTLAQKIPYLFVELINEAFGTEYTRKSKLEQLRNEFYEKGGKVVTDSIYKIGRMIYHLECQSYNDSKMVLRMVQYDFDIGLEQALKNNSMNRVELPKSCVLYLRSTRNTPSVLKTEIVQEGRAMVYESKVIKLSDYTMDKMFRKNLIVLIPYYFLRYEKELLKDSISSETIQSLIRDCKDIANKMRDDKNITEQEYTDIVDAFRKVASHLLRKHRNTKEEVNRIMGGEIYETASEKLIKKGKREEKANAIEQFAKYFYENGQAESIEAGRELAKQILKK